MQYKKDILFFTIAFGSKRYFDMATALKNSFEKVIQNLNLKYLMKNLSLQKKYLKGKKNLPKRLQIRKI